METLEAHLGETTSRRKLRRIARRHLQAVRKGQFTTIWPQVRNFAGVEAIRIEGLEHLDEALGRGKGAILVSAHFGFPRMIKPVLRSRGRRALLVARAHVGGPATPGREPRLTGIGSFVHTRLLHLPCASLSEERSREAIGADLPPSFDLSPYVEALERNEALIILADGRRAEAAHALPVAGIEISFAPGAVSIARSRGAALLPTFVVDDPDRQGPASLRLVIHPPLHPQITENPRGDLEENLRRFSSVYEKQIRAYPHNFFWDWVRDGAVESPRSRRQREASPSRGRDAHRRPDREFRRRGRERASSWPESQTSQIEATLREHVRSRYAGGASGLALESEDDLLESGVVDSMGVFELTSFIEEQFGVTVGHEDVVPDNFRSLGTMTRYVAAKKRIESEDRFVTDVRSLVTEAVPQDAVVLVVSYGDEALLALEGRIGWHFPRDDEGGPGFKPADGAEAIEQLEALRSLGATHIVFPQPALWWLEEYAGLREYLEARSGEVGRSEAGVVYALPAA